MITVRNLIRGACRLAGIVSQNEDITDEDLVIAKENLSALLDSWNTNPNMIWKKEVSTYPITSPQTSITLSQRPIRIFDVTFRIGDVVYTTQQIDEIDFYRTTIITAGIPRKWCWNGELILNLVGTGTGTIALITQPALIDLTTDIDAILTFPSGYENAIRFSLAVLLAQEYGREITPIMLSLAGDAVENLRSTNARPAITRSDASMVFGRRTSGFYNNFEG